jgi:hypothetical protein
MAVALLLGGMEVFTPAIVERLALIDVARLGGLVFVHLCWPHGSNPGCGQHLDWQGSPDHQARRNRVQTPQELILVQVPVPLDEIQ